MYLFRMTKKPFEKSRTKFPVCTKSVSSCFSIYSSVLYIGQLDESTIACYFNSHADDRSVVRSDVIKQATSVSSSHLFSLLCLYFTVFHDAKPEWEWTNLLLPERIEWVAAIRCVHTRDGARDGGIWWMRGRGGV